jgi:thymidine phosphorylase
MKQLPQEIIRIKRDSKPLSPDMIKDFVTGVTTGAVSDAQIAAFCMAALCRGMDAIETAELTRAMAHSGTVLKWNLDRPIIDKHSTGGVGDKVSLMLAPMASACGLAVPMIAGRGLGHTGGTIDKLESIHGFNTALSIDTFQNIVRDVGCAIIGQTAQFAPADKRLYAIRDVTATVESIPLITASILSKKLAAGLQGLVLDVKYGNGAFMAEKPMAEALARSLYDVATAAGLPLKPVITDMNSVLGHAAGNGVEVVEAIEYLNGTRRDARLHEVTLLLVAEMLVLGGIVPTVEQGKQRAQESLDSGHAFDIFERMIAAQGGDLKQITHAPHVVDILADRNGILTAMDTRAIGVLLVDMKAGRAHENAAIDLGVGFTDIAPLGIICEAGKTIIARAHVQDTGDGQWIAARFLKTLTL